MLSLSTPTPRTSEDVVTEIRELLKKVTDKRHLRLGSRRARLESLVQLLEELAMLLARQQHPATQDIEAVLEHARHLLVEHTSGKREALSADRLNPLVEKVSQALDRVDAPAGPQPERDRFWT